MSDKTIRRFIEAVYPDAPDLAMASFNEDAVLSDATNKIKRLRLERDNFRDLWDMDNEDLRICKDRIEELDRALAAKNDLLSAAVDVMAGTVRVKPEQIDAAWRLLWYPFSDCSPDEIVEEVLETIGVRTCRDCDGEKKRKVAYGHLPSTNCESCDGHGWVQNEPAR